MDRNTVMHNESVLTLFDPMTHTPARYVTFSTDYWLLVCLSRTLCIVNLDLVIVGWKDSTISWNATSAPWSAHRWNCVSFRSWLTQFKVSENSKLTQMHRKHHYHLSPQSHGSSTCFTFFRLALCYSALSLDFYHILISVIAPPPTNATINWLCLLHLFVWCFQEIECGIMCTYPTN